VQKPATMMLKPLKSKGFVSERNHADKRKLFCIMYHLGIPNIQSLQESLHVPLPVNGVNTSGANMLAKELIPDIHP
jgi:hypothetical protein